MKHYENCIAIFMDLFSCPPKGFFGMKVPLPPPLVIYHDSENLDTSNGASRRETVLVHNYHGNSLPCFFIYSTYVRYSTKAL